MCSCSYIHISRGGLWSSFSSLLESKVVWGRGGAGGWSLRDSTFLSEEEWDAATIVVLLLLKTGPSAESSSSSEGTITTPLFFSRGASKGEVLTMAKGIAAIGIWEVGSGVLWEGRGFCVVCGDAGCGFGSGEAGVGVAWAERDWRSGRGRQGPSVWRYQLHQQRYCHEWTRLESCPLLSIQHHVYTKEKVLWVKHAIKVKTISIRMNHKTSKRKYEQS